MLWETCPRCGHASLFDGECFNKGCGYPRLPFWAMLLFVVGGASGVIACAIFFSEVLK